MVRRRIQHRYIDEQDDYLAWGTANRRSAFIHFVSGRSERAARRRLRRRIIATVIIVRDESGILGETQRCCWHPKCQQRHRHAYFQPIHGPRNTSSVGKSPTKFSTVRSSSDHRRSVALIGIAGVSSKILHDNGLSVSGDDGQFHSARKNGFAVRDFYFNRLRGDNELLGARTNLPLRE